MGPLLTLRFEFVEANTLREGFEERYWYAVPRVGEYVTLAEGAEGFVAAIAWSPDWITIRLEDHDTLWLRGTHP